MAMGTCLATIKDESVLDVAFVAHSLRHEYAASLAAGWVVAWVDTPLLVLARFKQQFPALSYSAHASQIYSSRGFMGFYTAAGNGLHDFGRPNFLPGSGATIGVLLFSSCQGVAVWGTWGLLRGGLDAALAGGPAAPAAGLGAGAAAAAAAVRHPWSAQAVLEGPLGGALCGSVAGCVGALFSLPRDALTNLVLADEARWHEHGRAGRMVRSLVRLEGWQQRQRQPQPPQGSQWRIAGTWMRTEVARLLLGPGREIGSQRAVRATAAAARVSNSAPAPPQRSCWPLRIIGELRAGHGSGSDDGAGRGAAHAAARVARPPLRCAVRTRWQRPARRLF
jgi:hypothetical protein